MASRSVLSVGLVAVNVALLWLGACSSPLSQSSPATAVPLISAAPSTNAEVPQSTLPPGPLPLSEPGPYFVGRLKIFVEDASRENRAFGITVWYPAAEGDSTRPTWDARPDLGGAPYPLIISSTKVASIFAPYIVSRGFAWASVDGLDSYQVMMDEMYNQPLDILFALNYIATNPPEMLKGLIDAERAGVIGYSFDGYNALSLSGARVDPEHYLRQCPQPDPTTQAILSGLSAYGCGPAQGWDTFVKRAGIPAVTDADGLWKPITDPRIRAVIPLAAEGWWLFGERGLAAVDRPVLMMTATQDPLYKENVLIFEHLGTPDKTFISFIGPDHFMIYDHLMVARMAHFAAAFFGYYLQRNEDMAIYFSEAFVRQEDGLAWGTYPID